MRATQRWVLVGLALVVLGCAAWFGLSYFHPAPSGTPVNTTSTQAAAPAVSPEELRSTWIAGVSSTLAFYDGGGSPAEARDALLSLRVPGEFRDIHLDLVLAFQALVDKTVQAQILLEKARAAFVKISL